MYFPHKRPATVHRQFEGRAAQDLKAVALRKRLAKDRKEERLARRERLVERADAKRARKNDKRIGDRHAQISGEVFAYGQRRRFR